MINNSDDFSKCFIKMDILLITTVVLLAGFLPGKAFSQNHFKFTSNTGNNMTVLVQSAINPALKGKKLSSGDEIGAFTPDGLCVGSVIWNKKNVTVTVWGDNEQTRATDGAKNGDKIQFRIWDAQENAEYSTAVDFTSGSSHYTPDGIAILSRIEAEVNNNTAQSKPSVDHSASETASAPPAVDSSGPLHSEQKRTPTDKKSKNQVVSIIEKSNNKNTGKGAVTGGEITIDLLAPTDSAVISGDNLVFSWHNKAKKIKGYSIDIFTDSSLNKPALDSVLYTNDTSMAVNSLNNGIYWWRVHQADGGRVVGTSDKRRLVIDRPRLKSDPFSISWQQDDATGRSYHISFQLPALSSVRFKVLSNSGKKLHQTTERLPAGQNTIPVSVEKLGKGKYSYILETDFFTVQSTFSVE